METQTRFEKGQCACEYITHEKKVVQLKNIQFGEQTKTLDNWDSLPKMFTIFNLKSLYLVHSGELSSNIYPDLVH